jgi:hypothetical protein
MKQWRPTAGVALVLIAMLSGACGSSGSQPATKKPQSKSVLAACIQLDKQPKEQAESQTGYPIYFVPHSLVLALQNSGNAALQRLGEQLVVPGTDSRVEMSIPRAFNQGQSLCHSLIH